jgi:hypothetical protein
MCVCVCVYKPNPSAALTSVEMFSDNLVSQLDLLFFILSVVLSFRFGNWICFRRGVGEGASLDE